jgi:hypothetical protein
VMAAYAVANIQITDPERHGSRRAFYVTSLFAALFRVSRPGLEPGT